MKYYGLLILAIVTCVARTDAASTTAVADKLWATDLPAFLNDHPRQHWIVGRSDQPALSAIEAETAARRDAAQQIADTLGASKYGRMSARQATDWIAATVERGSWIVDRQIDATERPYGTIWRAAILVDADPKALDALATRMQDARVRQHAHAAAAVVIGIVWLMAVSFGYLLLNWLTRGYFRGRLALVSVVMIVAGFVGIAQVA
jgi:hypothetical protein